jgi:hypothetical protein
LNTSGAITVFKLNNAGGPLLARLLAHLLHGVARPRGFDLIAERSFELGDLWRPVACSVDRIRWRDDTREARLRAVLALRRLRAASTCTCEALIIARSYAMRYSALFGIFYRRRADSDRPPSPSHRPEPRLLPGL